MSLLGLGTILILSAGGAALVFRRRPAEADTIFRVLLLAGSGLGLIDAVRALVLPAPTGAPVDPLSGWFLLLVLGVGGAVAMYGVPYLNAERPQRQVAFAHAQFAILLCSMIGVVTARSALSFLAAWEVMAITAFLLVIFERERPEVRRAGFVYLVLTHTSTLALVAAFAAWGGAVWSAGFDTLAPAAALGDRLPWVLGLTLIGFGIKAGVVPVHFWLPGAHTAAPSHVSALLSGVMIKMGIYGLLRTAQLLGSLPAWWGWLMLGLGLVTGVLGVLWALAQHDLKRLLAYHSVENIGIILLGLGVGVLGVAYHLPLVATLGFAGALLHTLNHALFKSLLFLGAGAVVRATGTRAIDRLGGLARRMPQTAAAFLLGSVAICGLPPLNGFVSEWLVLRGMLETGHGIGPVRLALAAAPGLALIGGLAVACFTKINGVIFLGSPRQLLSDPVTDPAPGMLAPVWTLAAACLILGLVPIVGMLPASRVAAFVAGAPATGAAGAAAAAGALTVLSVGFLAICLGLWLANARKSKWPVQLHGVTWAGGAPTLSPRMQYTASSYAASLLSAFGSFAGLEASRSPGELHTHPVDLVLDRLVRPGWNRVRQISQHARLMQAGRVRWYLLYVILTLVILLLYLWNWGR